MIVKPTVAALLASGLVAPDTTSLVLPKPAIVKAGNLDFSRHMLFGMPLTMGMLPGGAMSYSDIAFVGGNTGGSTSSQSISLTALTGGTGSSIAEGDLILVFTHPFQESDANFTPQSGYTKILDIVSQSGGRYANLAVSSRIAGASPPTSYTAVANAYTVVTVWRNVDSATPFDVTRTTFTGSGNSSANPPSITTVTPKCRIVAAVAANGVTGTPSVPSGYTSFLRFGSILGVASKQLVNAATEDPPSFGGYSAIIVAANVTYALRPKTM